MRQLDVDQNGVAYHKNVAILKTAFFGEDVRMCAFVCVCICALVRSLNMLGTGNCSSQEAIYNT
jgi:hypothetical protein